MKGRVHERAPSGLLEMEVCRIHLGAHSGGGFMSSLGRTNLAARTFSLRCGVLCGGLSGWLCGTGELTHSCFEMVAINLDAGMPW